MKHNIYMLMLALVMGLGFVACSDNDPDGPTIFPVTSPERDQLDMWLQKNYTSPYNIDFKYKMEDIESDYQYTLTPADSAKSAKLAIIIKYLWLDSYTEVLGPDFVKHNVPRVIHLIGSPAYNSNGTVVLGTAEGGLKVTLYQVNSLTDAMLESYASMTEYYFHTMHHEFTHILNQKKPYDTSIIRLPSRATKVVTGIWLRILWLMARVLLLHTPCLRVWRTLPRCCQPISLILLSSGRLSSMMLTSMVAKRL